MKLKILLLIVLFTLSACASNVSIDYDQKTPFASYRTYQLIKPEHPKDLKFENPEVDNTLVRDRIESAVHNELQLHGFQRADEADFYVTYYLQVTQEIESRNSGISVGYGHWGRGIGMRYGFPGYDFSTYDKGTLTIDILQPVDKKLVWRGSSSRRLNRAGSTPQSNEQVVREVVKEILAEFPPHIKK